MISNPPRTGQFVLLRTKILNALPRSASLQVLLSSSEFPRGRQFHAFRRQVDSILLGSAVGGAWMRYIIAWMLGVPFSVIVLWYVVGHAACG
jgi:hypothetical protein